MAGRVAGKGIVITGAGSGMGRAFALGLAREGAIGRCPGPRPGCRRARSPSEIAAEPAPAVALHGGRQQAGAGRRGAGRLHRRAVGQLDVLFNNAGFNRPMHLLDVTEENWHSIMDVNALGHPDRHPGGREADDPAARRQDRQHVVDRGPAGLSQLRAVLREQVRGQRAHPGRAPGRWPSTTSPATRSPRASSTPRCGRQLDADLLEIGDAERPGQAMADFSAGILRGRPATPEDLVGTALFLASSDSDYLTGQVVMADGGMVLV